MCVRGSGIKQPAASSCAGKLLHPAAHRLRQRCMAG
jgi:hypothetical protein